MKKQLLAMLMAVCLALSSLPTAALAAGETYTPTYPDGVTNETFADSNTVCWSVGSGVEYAATLAGALTASYKAGAAGGITIWCRENADVGALTHGHVADDITIYGNNAYISGGECDLEVDTFKYSRLTGMQAADGAYLDKDITIRAYDLQNLGVWGQRTTEHTVNIWLENCSGQAGSAQRVYLSGAHGTNNITLTGCDFTGGTPCTVYSNAPGSITISDCTFTNVQEPINIKHKGSGNTAVSIKDCTFTGCGSTGTDAKWAAPIRLVDESSGALTASVTGCAFSGTVGNNGDILVGDGRTGETYKEIDLTVANTAAEVQVQMPGYYTGTGTDTDTGKVIKTETSGTGTSKINTDAALFHVAEVNGTGYASLSEAVAAAGKGDTVKLLKDTAGAGVVFGDSAGTEVNVIIDLGGHTYTLNKSVGSSSKYATVGFYLWAGSTVAIKNGTIRMIEDIPGDAYTFFKIFHSKGNLTLTDVTLDCTNGVAYNGDHDDGFIAVESDAGSVTIDGDTSVVNCGNISPETWTLVAYGSGKITIDTTGTIDGVVAAYTRNASVEIKNGNFVNSKTEYDQLLEVSSGSLSVSGGTFSEDPSAFCTDGFVSYKNASGTYGIIEGTEEEKQSSAEVVIKVTPADAEIVLKKGDTVIGTAAGTYLLPAGEYTLSAALRGYYPETRTIVVPVVEAGQQPAGQTVKVELEHIYYRPVSSGSTTSHPVSVNAAANGSISADLRSAKKGDTVIITVTPDEGYALAGLTVTDSKGSELAVTDLGSGKVSFTMPASRVEIRAQFAPLPDEPAQVTFTDIPAGAYYEIPAAWAVEKGLTTGVGNGRFDPNGSCTRQQIVTFLWRLAGCPSPITRSLPADVNPDSYYAMAVAWAVENSITTGNENGLFDPDGVCTRAQAVTFLFRTLGASAAGKSGFTDVPDGAFYADAVAWAVQNGVTGGVGGGLFAPDGTCTRAEIVTFLYRAMA